MDPISVNKGDNLTKIAKKYDTTVEELLKLNPQLKDRPNTIFVGEKINLPKPPSETPYPGLGVEMQNDEIPKAPWQEGKKPIDTKTPKSTQGAEQTSGDTKSYALGAAAGAGGSYAAYKAVKKAKVKMKDAKAAIDKAKASGREKMSKLKSKTKKAFKYSPKVQSEINIYKGAAKTQSKLLFKQGKHVPYALKTILNPNEKNKSKKHVARTFMKEGFKPQAKTTASIYRAGLKRGWQIAKETKGVKFLGRAAAPAAAAFECYNIGKAYKEGGTKKAAKQAGVSGASLGGAWAGAKAGAAVGAFGGPIGAAVGGIVGGVVGYAAGNWLGRKILG